LEEASLRHATLVEHKLQTSLVAIWCIRTSESPHQTHTFRAFCGHALLTSNYN